MLHIRQFATRAISSTARMMERFASDPAIVDSPSAHKASVIRSMTNYDMVKHPDESYYSKQYLHWIVLELSNRYPDRNVQIVDLGCGQGRLSVPLAEWCAPGQGSVTGVDITPAAVALARQYAVERSVSNAYVHEEDVLDFARELKDESADVILLIEVSFILPSYRQVLTEAARILRPGGVLFAAFRSQYFNLLHTVRGRSWEGAEMVLAAREGHLFGGPTWLGWQTPDDVDRLLEDAGFFVLKQRAIGACSGVKGDSLEGVARPSQLSAEEQERLMKIECAIAEQYAACGRYILATAEKRGA
jgi:2-polyprenyl-3-methyl-5-hydroxy-6-metoxy-1,4-benzoquinol methylase